MEENKLNVKWKTKYCGKNELEPDKHGRWLRVCYVEVPKEEFEFTMPYIDNIEVPLFAIHQKNTTPGCVPSLKQEHKFACSIPTIFNEFNDCSGLSITYFYSDDVADLEKRVEKHFFRTIKVLSDNAIIEKS